MDIVDKLRDHTEPPLDSRGNPMYSVCYDAADEILRLRKIEAAARNLVSTKGRYHTQQAYQLLSALVVPNAPELTGSPLAASPATGGSDVE